ncbi:dihydrodipicolinate reductase C-terminal domain-containing protein, partial [Clostridioides difficile]
ATTPAMFMTTIMDGYNSDGAIMITASHLPYYYNGLKFFTESGPSNTSLGVNILIKLVKDASKMLEGFDIEIIEKHHNRKEDAPSG